MAKGATASLRVRGGSNNGMTIHLSGRPINLGRRNDNDVVVDETTVSRRHGLIMETPAGFVILDLNTTNGTFVNQDKIGLEEYVLTNGDAIRLAGSKVTFLHRRDRAETEPMGGVEEPTGEIVLRDRTDHIGVVPFEDEPDSCHSAIVSLNPSAGLRINSVKGLGGLGPSTATRRMAPAPPRRVGVASSSENMPGLGQSICVILMGTITTKLTGTSGGHRWLNPS